MKMPKKSPPLESILGTATPEIMAWAMEHAMSGDASGDTYWHWDELRFRPPPAGLPTQEAWWTALQCQRLFASRKLAGLTDKGGVEWRVVMPAFLQAQLSELDRLMAVRVLAPSPGDLSPETRDQFVVEYLTQEAWASSFIEGAVATREQAREMVNQGRTPRDASERMVLNNFHALEQVRVWRDRPLSPEMVAQLQAQVVEGTDVKPEDVGKLRLRQVVVSDAEGEVLHEPPSFEELPRRLKALCDFANAQDGLHPIVRAVALHFMLAYDHPFGDGNGRTARALFYWAMLRAGYWLIEFMPISDVIRRAPRQYGRAFLLAETDNQDFTHFLAYHLDALRKANAQFNAHVAEKRAKEAGVAQALAQAGAGAGLNDRQRSVLRRMLTGELKQVSFESHLRDHRITYVTARKDLEGMLRRGLLAECGREGKRRVFARAETKKAREISPPPSGAP